MAVPTEIYCEPAGAGGHTGVDWANSYTWAEMQADTTINSNVNLSGAFPFSTNATTGAATRTFTGWNAAKTAIATSWSDAPSLDVAGLVSGTFLQPLGNNAFAFIEFLNTPSTAIASSTADQIHVAFCKFTDCAKVLQCDNYSSFAFNKVSGFGAASNIVQADIAFRAVGNEFTGGTGATVNVISAVQSGSLTMLNFFDGAGVGTAITQTGVGALSALNTIDSCDRALYIQSGMAIMNQITNNTNAIQPVAVYNSELYNNLFNNSVDHVANTPSMLAHATAVDPNYVGLPDYTIQEASQIEITMMDLILNLNVGASQKGPASGGGGGLLVHPGMSGGMRG